MSFILKLVSILGLTVTMASAKSTSSTYDVYDLKRGVKIQLGLVGEPSLLVFTNPEKVEIENRINEFVALAASEGSFKNIKVFLVLDESGRKKKELIKLTENKPIELVIDQSGLMKKNFLINKKSGAVLLTDAAEAIQTSELSKIKELDFAKVSQETSNKGGGK